MDPPFGLLQPLHGCQHGGALARKIIWVAGKSNLMRGRGVFRGHLIARPWLEKAARRRGLRAATAAAILRRLEVGVAQAGAVAGRDVVHDGHPTIGDDRPR